MIFDNSALKHYAYQTCRAPRLSTNLAILGKILPENGFDQLNRDRLEELYKELESKGKDEKSSIADELGFPIRKRSAPRKPKGSEDSDVEKKPEGKLQPHSCFPAETEYKDKIQELIDEAAKNGENSPNSENFKVKFGALSLKQRKNPSTISLLKRIRTTVSLRRNHPLPRNPDLHSLRLPNNLDNTRNFLKNRVSPTCLNHLQERSNQKRKRTNLLNPLLRKRNLSSSVLQFKNFNLSRLVLTQIPTMMMMNLHSLL